MSIQIDALSEVGKQLQKYDKSVEVLDLPNFTGTQSMFNPYVVFSLHDIGESAQAGGGGKYNYTLHYDMLVKGSQPGHDISLDVPAMPAPNPSDPIPGFIPMSDALSQASAGKAQDRASRTIPTASNIIKYSKDVSHVFGYGPAPYSWADFLYCKYYGKIPNNRLVTLRRYPYPVSDNVVVPNANAVVPVAQAVTWFSEETGNKLSEIMKMTYGVMWKEIEAQVQVVEGNEQALGTGIESFLGGKAVSALGTVLTASRGSYDLWSGRREKEVDWARKAYTNDGPYWNQIYGPVNVVHKSHMRDRGVKFQHEITLKFHYSIKSYAGVNPKVAMLDLLANFLILTYTNAKFWGGATRYFPNATFRTGFLGDQQKFYSGDYRGYAQSVGDQMKGTMSNLMDGFNKLLSGDFSGLIKTVTELIGGSLSEKSQPQILSIRSLLSGDPVGEWHLTVGNPMNPIAVIGNLIMEDATMELGETLGADDFPTEVTFTVKLKPGKPRDKGDIESMFNNGYGRMTYAPITTLPSQQNTFGSAAGNPSDTVKNSKEIQELYAQVQDNGVGYKQLEDLVYTDPAASLIKKRVTEQWGNTFGSSANLMFMINSTKSRF
jgi:hypothetical protein